MFNSSETTAWTILCIFCMAVWVVFAVSIYSQYTKEGAKHNDSCIQDLKVCAEELSGPEKCGKLWGYAQQLEEENARLNKLLRAK